MILPFLFACTTADSDTGEKDGDPDGFEALAGLVFVQDGEDVGVGSYAFSAEDNIYIDYSAAPSGWARDDGSALPAQEPFVDPSYEGIQTFRATIDWVADGATVGGDARWDYVMVFDEGYTTIESGTVDAFAEDGTHRYTLQFGVDLFYSRGGGT